MTILVRYALEIVSSVWLVLVAAQFASSYFLFGMGEDAPDFRRAYVVMLILTVGVCLHRAIRPRKDMDT